MERLVDCSEVDYGGPLSAKSVSNFDYANNLNSLDAWAST